jgi:pyruvate kinase
LIAKLERPLALEHLEEILAACDAVMVARGDLGLEMPLERVPRAQKEITRRARLAGKPVIVATQVLESMTVEARPTRAEVNDAANAVEDGVDAIMLAGETAAGAHPAGAVKTLNAIIGDAESAPAHHVVQPQQTDAHDTHARALCQAAVTLADRSAAQAIVAVTRGGTTARSLSALRPHAPIFAATERPDTGRRLTLYWGVVPLCMPLGDNLDEASTLAGAQLVERGLVSAGATAVFVSINADLTRRDANYLKIQRL